MRRPAWLRFDLSPLGHPVWWAALALLAANDHLFKGAGVLPGWVTGKLSDFAFLTVAPVLAAALLPVAVRRRRTVALVAVGGLFAAAKLSRVVSDDLVAVLRHAGVTWRLWTDPTDLVALVTLPVAARLVRRVPVRSRRARERAGVLVGALACLATSAPPSHSHNPFLLNASPAPAPVTITWLLRAVPCDLYSDESPTGGSVIDAGVAEALAGSLTPGDLEDPIQIDLQRGQVAALDGEPLTGVSPAGVCTAAPALRGSCVAAILDSPPAAAVLMVAPAQWSESDSGAFFTCDSPPPPLSRCQPMMDPDADAGPDAVTLKMEQGTLRFVAGAKIRLAPIDVGAVASRTSPPDSCRALRQQYEALLQPQGCASDADCLAVPNLPVPGVAAPCGVDANRAGAQALSRLGVAWDAACVTGSVPDCYVPQPAVCRAGSCAAACPGEQIPLCPSACYEMNGSTGAACDDVGTPCVRRDALVCDCVNSKIACAPPQPLSATCPLTCNDPPGGGSYVDGQILHPNAGGPPDAAPPADGSTTGDGSAASDAGARD